MRGPQAEPSVIPGGNHLEQTVLSASLSYLSTAKIKSHLDVITKVKRDNQAAMHGGFSMGLIWISLYGWLWCFTSADRPPHLVPVLTLISLT